MKILIVEDDINKLTAIKDLLSSLNDIEYHYEMSYHSGMRIILNNQFDLVLLDMSMPLYDVTLQETGGRPLALAGRDILFQIRRRKLRIKTIIVTQYEEFDGLSLNELNCDLKSEFPDNYIGYVYYNVTQDTWKEMLCKLLAQHKMESEVYL